jgi:hypothetical protein
MEGQGSLISSRDMETRYFYIILGTFPNVCGCSGATCIYACCIVGKVRICGKIVFLALGFAKRDDKCA